ncbi:MAG: ABC transporter ATP-binding protein [Spirochaetia bacterium]|nr:ABC transporter ATP-binding protein [Spirochaetia bacterium]
MAGKLDDAPALGIFLRLLAYSFHYRSRILSGIFVSFIVAVLNGLSLTAFIPLFDALGDRRAVFEIQFSHNERAVLARVIRWVETERAKGTYAPPTDVPAVIPAVPPSPEKIKREMALVYLNATFSDSDYGLSRLDSLWLRTLIRWKLRINAAGLSPLNVVFTACLIVFPLYVVRLLLHLVSVRLIAGTGYQAVRDIRQALYDKAQNLPLTYYYREKTGLLMSRIINDVEIVAAVISSNMRDAITNVFYILVNLVILAYLNWQLLILCLLTIPLVLSPNMLFSRKIRSSTSRTQQLLADLNAHVQESIGGVRVIRAFAMETAEMLRFKAVNARFYWRTFKEQFYVRFAPNLVELTSTLVTLGIIGLGAYYADATNFTGGEFFAFLITLLFILRPIIQLSSMYSKVMQASSAGRRVFEIMDAPLDAVDPVNPTPLRPMKDAIVFENVSFTYPGTDKQVLSDVNLRVPAGSTVALVGESGAGKSTLVDLLARFFEPTTGRITIDGQDIRSFRAKDHRSRIGIVQQDVFLFHGTVHENIAYGRTDYTHDQVEAAARLAHAHTFIRELADGYHTVLGELGLTLSGGQRQRVSMSRALLRNPEILILDEATSALDTESEREVQRALEHLVKNRTTFVIAHRLSTIESADLIVVISGGKIVDMGTHDDLIQRVGLYQRLQDIARRAHLQ